MKLRALLGVASAAVLALVLTACASTPSSDSSLTPVIAPVTMSTNELQGATVQLVVGQSLNIDTGDLPVESYSGTVTVPTVAAFVAGRNDGSATFNPGVKGLSVGMTEVTLVNDQGGIEPLTFMVEVGAD